MPECIGMETLFSFQIFTRNYKIRGGIVSFASKMNFRQTYVSEILLRKSNACFFVEIRIYVKTPLF